MRKNVKNILEKKADGLGVIEIILIIVDIFTIPNLCMQCLFSFKKVDLLGNRQQNTQKTDFDVYCVGEEDRWCISMI